MTAWAENKTTVEGTITEENKGGLVAKDVYKRQE